MNQDKDVDITPPMRQEKLNREFILNLHETVKVDSLYVTFESNQYPVIDKAANADNHPGVLLTFKTGEHEMQTTFYLVPQPIDFAGYYIRPLERLDASEQVKIIIEK